MAATDKFGKFDSILESPGKKAFSISKSDANELAFVTRYIYIGGTGDITVKLAGDSAAVLFKAVPAGTLLPLRVKQVMSTGTDATYIVGIY